jgi:hypothetical protein
MCKQTQPALNAFLALCEGSNPLFSALFMGLYILLKFGENLSTSNQQFASVSNQALNKSAPRGTHLQPHCPA